MLFNSYEFWAFCFVVLVIYYRLGHRWQNRFLLAASYVFYGCWDWRFLSLILASTVVDFFVAQRLHSTQLQQIRKRWLLVSVATNLGILGVFKYFGFFAAELSSLLQTVGAPLMLPTLDIVLPVGISFYTFQTMSYTIDVYRRQAEPARRFDDFALFVCFFPQLVAGPIERFSRLMPQIESTRRLTTKNFSDGLYYILLGLFKKVVIADTMASIANAVFATPAAELSGADCLIGVYAFALQIYGDFSGYSSIAQGVAKWLGFDLMDNFRMPYFATTPSDFWRRWHISLSQWLRDYLYIALGGNRGGRWKTYRNLILTMTLGGLWHGAGWTFLAWGIFHGLILCIYRAAGLENASEKRPTVGVAHWIGRVTTSLAMFHLVCFGWLLFRAESMSQVVSMLHAIATDWTWRSINTALIAMIAWYVLPLLAYELWVERRGDLLSLQQVDWRAKAAAYSYCVLMLLVFSPIGQQEFIYFQF